MPSLSICASRHRSISKASKPSLIPTSKAVRPSISYGRPGCARTERGQEEATESREEGPRGSKARPQCLHALQQPPTGGAEDRQDEYASWLTLRAPREREGQDAGSRVDIDAPGGEGGTGVHNPRRFGTSAPSRPRKSSKKTWLAI